MALYSAAHGIGTFPAITLPALVEATPAQSVWHLAGAYDPVFPDACDTAPTAMSASGPALVYVSGCHYAPDDGLNLVMVVQGPRCVVSWEGIPIERRHCLSVPLLRAP